jgi:hypothetical protein
MNEILLGYSSNFSVMMADFTQSLKKTTCMCVQIQHNLHAHTLRVFELIIPFNVKRLTDGGLGMDRNM